MNVLALGAHFDDIELGCAGALYKHRLANDRVICYVATHSGFSGSKKSAGRSATIAAEEGKAAARILGVELVMGSHQTLHLEFEDTLNFTLVRLIEENNIDLIYTHWQGDVHHDHRALHYASLHAGRHVPRILLYHSNWYTGTESFSTNYYTDISACWGKKEAAIRAHQSEILRVGSDWVEWAKADAQVNGKVVGVQFAEGFSCIRWLQ